jgi:hypothetical protein
VIPVFNQSGVLPPFLNQEPTQASSMAPYPVTMLELAEAFATSQERVEILLGLIAYREHLRAVGIEQGFQWIAGSFLEECEKQRRRPPNDIDVVTFARRPATAQSKQDWTLFVGQHQHLFDVDWTKENHKCDAQYVDLFLAPEAVVLRTRFWFGLFSHQRDTYVWKGLLELPLSSNDDDAKRYLGERNVA